MQIPNSTVLITGANRGIGLAFANAFIERGARKGYAGARNPSKVSLPGVTPPKLDVNSDADAQAAAQLASDATIVVNMGFEQVKTSLSAQQAVYLAAR